MRWFRLRQRWGSYLALAALVFQLAIACSHVHLDHAHLGHAESHAGDAAIAAGADHGPEAPSTPEGPDQDHCAICALIHLTQTLVAPTAPILALPVAFERHALIAVATELTAPHPALFRARAPPIA